MLRKSWKLNRVLSLALLVLALGACGGSPKNQVTIQKHATPVPAVSVRVDFANTDEARMRGLMFRKSMGAKEGMLFLFDRDTASPFWMKNTYLPLDILFIDANREIVSIIENTKPLSEELIRPGAPYRYVLEVNAGFAKQHRIEQGDRVTF